MKLRLIDPSRVCQKCQAGRLRTRSRRGPVDVGLNEMMEYRQCDRCGYRPPAVTVKLVAVIDKV